MATIQPQHPLVEMDADNNLYYNVRIQNDGKSDLFSVANYNVSRTSPILERPSDYELAVVRFSIPAQNIPIMVWNNWENKLSLTMSFGGTDITKVLQFIPNSSGNDFYGDTIWNYQEFVDIINVALRDAFIDMKTAQPLAPPTEAPYMVYNPVSKLCSLYAQQLYDTGSPLAPPPPSTIELYFNNPLFLFFPSLQAMSVAIDTPKAYKIVIKDNKNNIPPTLPTYYEMKQEYTTLALWNDFTQIVFATDHIPVEPEFQPTVNDTTRRIITDFEPLADINNRQAFQYFGSGWKRYYDLKSEYPLRDIDLRVYWEDKDGTLFPIYLGEGDVLTAKILFKRKTSLRLNQALGYTDDDD